MTYDHSITSNSCHYFKSWEIFQALIRIPHNTHSINSLLSSSHSQTLSQVCLGYGLYPIASSLNHSCVPNIIIKFNQIPQQEDNNHENNNNYNNNNIPIQIELIAFRDIQSNEELTISYGPTGREDVEERRNLLYNQYQFYCSCELCIEQLNEKSSSNSTISHTTTTTTSSSMNSNENYQILEQLKMSLLEIKQQFETINFNSSPNIRKIRKYRESCNSIVFLPLMRLFKENSKKITDNLQNDELNRLIEERNSIEDILCSCNDFMGQISAIIGEYREAIQYIENSINILTKQSKKLNKRKVLNEDDVIILREKVKIVELLFHNQEWKECHKLAYEIRNKLKPFINIDLDEDYQELIGIIYQIENMK